MTTSPPITSTSTSTMARWLALGAIAGPTLFTLAWLILGSLSTGYPIFGARIEPYSPIAQPISGLGLGDTAPFMNAAFVVGGVMLLAGVAGIAMTVDTQRRRTARMTCAVLLAATPVGMIIDGVFDLEAMVPHSIGFLLAAGVPVASFLVAGSLFRTTRRHRRLGLWLLVASPVILALVVGFFLTFEPTVEGAGHGIAGLVQRLLVSVVLASFVAMAWPAFRQTR
ncbi:MULTISPECIES: DUF998 domain-containing protein [Streptosporangium]|uniref:DUF998 domain-containing protein n=1 Tax=Streptosporangium brasiliense TaxID=47480 RepID=A0ABT9RAB0_9ACTN|nr:DUF998 domain-containing protein [Streptosporangium brasiliense]MDP9866184.1 hypothetical protein [Streptosporangium brasiliense]